MSWNILSLADLNPLPRFSINPRGLSGALLAGALLAGAVLGVSATAVAQTPGAEQAHIWQADSDELEWGPCPEFMPEGCGIAVLQGDPEQRNADVFFRLPGESTVARHWHTSAERMVLVSGELEVDYDGQEPVTMQPGTYAYGPAKLPHTTVCASAEPCVLFIAFEEPVDAEPGAPD
ncbi:MAG: cupin domain-containing protein [Pseudomonadales bacterium]